MHPDLLSAVFSGEREALLACHMQMWHRQQRRGAGIKKKTETWKCNLASERCRRCFLPFESLMRQQRQSSSNSGSCSSSVGVQPGCWSADRDTTTPTPTPLCGGDWRSRRVSAYIKEPLAGGKQRPGTEEIASRLELFLKSRRPKQFASKRVHSGTKSFHVN